jgi:hypothetical protein
MTDLPSPDDLARQRHELANAMLTMTEQLTPIFDTADGMRADLEKRGWSPTAAEKVALSWLLGAVGMVMGGAK